MSDESMIGDDRWQRKKARNRQNAAMWRGDLHGSNWPPEGTRVRTRDASESPGEKGTLVRHDEVRLVETEDGGLWYVQRHEIEVIDDATP